MNRSMEDFTRVQSPRPETPEPDSRQGRRNPRAAGVQLLDNDGAISVQLESCLKHIFAKYCTPTPVMTKSGVPLIPEGAYLDTEGLDAWAVATNGKAFDEETKNELVDFMDITEEGFLTYKGFIQVYQLQTQSDEEETWKDLSAHGYDRTLKLVASRREDLPESDVSVPAWVADASLKLEYMLIPYHSTLDLNAAS
ncbi:hypothetical protein EUX98_g226 [Antrodiella citrinella]|uniref:EF-hand domain-containing protein n=1 Tax=Antrodiella citrinella TaxID=2447956 RepID=A0A4S4N7H2_9APHY|nr:hypothetical protein EUX98_g226 [Antrodiella citrinella]